MVNRNYGKIDQTGKFEYAPVEVRVNGSWKINPSAESYRLADDGPWLPVVDQKPDDKLGVYWIAVGWEQKDEKIWRKYEERPIVAPEPINRHWTKLKMKTALAEAGWLAQVKTVLAGIEIAPSYSAAEAFADCDYIEERWPDAGRWNELLDTIAEQLGKTRDEIDTFLDAVPTDNGVIA